MVQGVCYRGGIQICSVVVYAVMQQAIDNDTWKRGDVREDPVIHL